MIVDLDNLTLDEVKDLQKKLNDREAELKEIELQEKQKEVEKRINYIKEHSDIILPLIQHDRSSCSDTNRCNGYDSSYRGSRCKKCHLLDILDDYYDNRFDVEFEVVITDTER